MEWLGTAIVLIILIVIVGLVVWSLVRQKKAGKSSCGCGCENCPGKNHCHKF